MAKLFLLGLCCSIVAALCAIIENSQTATAFAIGLALATVEMLVLTKAAGGFTPVILPIVLMNTVLLGSLLLWNDVRAQAKVSIWLSVTEDYQIQAAVIGIVFTAAYTVGAVLAGPRSVSLSLGQVTQSIAEFGGSLRVPNGALVGFGYAWVALKIYAAQGALLQGKYLQADGPSWAVMLSNTLAPVALLALGMAAVRHKPWRGLAVFGIGLWLVFLFAGGTRTFAGFPVLMLLAATIASGHRVRTPTILVAVVGTFVMLHVVLVGRSNPDGVGLVPLGMQLFTRPEELFTDFSLNAILGNVFFSGPLTAVVAHRPIPAEAFWIGINPMPGGLAGWHEIQDSLRLNTFTPYNALGELAAHGWIPLVFAAAAAGFGFALATRVASSLINPYALVATIFVLLMVGLFSVSGLQYNLRSTMRFVWYALLGTGALWFALGILGRPKSGSTGNRALDEHEVRPISQSLDR